MGHMRIVWHVKPAHPFSFAPEELNRVENCTTLPVQNSLKGASQFCWSVDVGRAKTLAQGQAFEDARPPKKCRPSIRSNRGGLASTYQYAFSTVP